MGFKIVQTTEEEEEVLTVVPESWENNGYLYWPPVRRGYLARKNMNTFPDETWSKTICVVKRDKIPTFKEALMEEKSMSKFEDTADEENFKIMQKEDRLHPHRKLQNYDDFNHLMTHKVNEPSQLPSIPFIRTAPVPQQSDPHVLTITDESISPVIRKQDDSEIVLISNDMGIFTVPGEVNSQSTQEEKINELRENQQNLINQVEMLRKSIAGLHAKFDLLLATLEISVTDTPKNKSNIYSEELMTSLLQLFPISNVEQLNKFELNLKEQDIRSRVVKHFSRIGGTDGNKNSNRITYMVVDAMFNRSFLTLCSWTGSSKKKLEKKVAFLQYKEVLNIFLDIIHLVDSRYTVDDNNNFFKKLKNSASRVAQRSAASTFNAELENQN